MLKEAESVSPPDSGFSNKKNQITNHKYQTNHNDRNSKFQTDDQPAFVPNGLIIGGQKAEQRYGTTVLNIFATKTLKHGGNTP